MAKSTKKTAKAIVNVVVPAAVAHLRAVALKLDETPVPEALQERFDSQIAKSCKRIETIAKSIEKAINHEATKDERDAKKTERNAKRKLQLEKQLAAVQAKLEKLNS